MARERSDTHSWDMVEERALAFKSHRSGVKCECHQSVTCSLTSFISKYCTLALVLESGAKRRLMHIIEINITTQALSPARVAPGCSVRGH